jgi:hypothetical protein
MMFAAGLKDLLPYVAKREMESGSELGQMIAIICCMAVIGGGIGLLIWWLQGKPRKGQEK